MFAPFLSSARRVPRAEATWFYAGRVSSFPDILPPAADAADEATIATARPCGDGQLAPGCKVFSVPADYGADGAAEVAAVAGSGADGGADGGADEERADPAALRGQVLVFKYRGQLHAVDHKCPHSSFPLSRAAPFDIEDFGLVLSAGLTCPKHGWSFDMFTGLGDRGNYRLAIWEVQLRDAAAADAADGPPDPEVWVRRKPRIG